MFTGKFSGLFAPLFVCPEHGETWHIESSDVIVDMFSGDTERIHVCARCHKGVTQLLHDGVPVMHPLTDEEAYWDSYTGEDDEAGWGAEGSVCHRCGGEHGDGWSNCTCDMDEEG